MFVAAAEKVAAGDIDGGLTIFFDTIDGEGGLGAPAGRAETTIARQRAHMIGQVGENRRPLHPNAMAESIRTPRC